jgi:hypothetical protein
MEKRIFTLVLLIFGLIMINQRTIAQVTPEVTVIQPSDANIEWIVGNTYLISWTDNFTMPVNIDLVDYDNGGAVTPIASNIEGSTYSWEVKSTDFAAGIKYKVRVSSAIVSSYADESDNFFTLAVSATGTTVHVEQPNLPNVSWLRGTTQVISWIDNIPGKVNVQLINDDVLAADDASFAGYAGGLWGQGTNGGFGFNPWNVDYAGSTDGRIDDPSSAGIVGMNNPAFYLSSTPGSYIYTDRPFAAPLEVGSTFSFDLGMLADNGGSGSKGVEIYAGNTSMLSITKLIDIEQTSGNTIYINGNPMFENYGVNKMTIHCEYVSVGSLRVYGVGRDGSETFDDIIAISGVPALVRFGTEDVSDMDVSRRLYFNNLKISAPNVYLATNATGSTFYWDIPDSFTLGQNYKIKVISVDDPSIFDLSDNYFSIVATLGGTVEVLQPNVATEIIIGQPYLISWIDEVAEKLTVELVKYVGGSAVSFTRLTPVGGINGSTFIWNVPNDVNLIHDTYKIKVVSTIDGTVQDKSDAYFSLVQSLNGTVEVIQPNAFGTEIIIGSQYLISWVDNLSENVVIELVKYTGATATSFTRISPVGGVSGSTFIWDVPNDMSLVYDHYKIKVVSINNGTLQDKSDNEFKILAHPEQTIEVLQPSIMGIEWVIGNEYLISWIDDVAANVKIDLCDQHGAFISNIATSVVGSTFVWDTDGMSMGYYKIRVSSTQDNNVVALSEHPFHLISSAPGSIEILQPNGGEFIFTNTSYLISWIDDIAENVDIKIYQYSNSSGDGQVGRYEFLDVPGSTMIWNVLPNYTGSYFKVRIKSSDPNSTTAPDWSDDFFAISPPIMAAVYPNPSSDYFNLRLDEQLEGMFDVIVYDRFNNRMIQRQVNAATKEHRINTAQLPNGIYFMQITNGKTTITEKIVVRH